MTAKREQNQEAVDDLEAIAPYPGEGLTRERILYSEADRAAINQGNVTLGRILEEWMQVDYRNITEVPFPLLMFMGRHDYTTPSAPTASWIGKVRAPSKRAVWFDHSSHLIPFEEPGKTLLTLVEHVRPLTVANGD